MIEEVKENIDTAGNRAGTIQRMQIVRHLFCQGNPLWLRRFGDFIAGGIQDDAWMVVVLLHHILQILLPPLRKVIHIVMQGFVDIPVINVFIHHQHAEPVADLKRCLGTGIMG